MASDLLFLQAYPSYSKGGCVTLHVGTSLKVRVAIVSDILSVLTLTPYGIQSYDICILGQTFVLHHTMGP